MVTPLVKRDRLFPIGLAGDRGGNIPGRQPGPNRIAVLRLIAQEFPGFVQGHARQQRGQLFHRGNIPRSDQKPDQVALAIGQSQPFGSQSAPAFAAGLGLAAFPRGAAPFSAPAPC